MTGVDMRHLPEICASTDAVGGLLPQAAEELGLAPGTPVFSGGTDISLCQIGGGCTEIGDVNVYSGTSGWVETTVGKLHTDIQTSSERSPAQTRQLTTMSPRSTPKLYPKKWTRK